MPDWSKLIAGKIALAKRGSSPSISTKLNATDIAARIPAGQTQVKNFPVLDMGIKPDIPTNIWSLRVYGLVENAYEINWSDFMALPQISDTSDFHCVTRWSQLDMDWQGVRAQDLLSRAKPLENARFATLHGYDGYTTNLPIEALLDDDVLVAHTVLGKPLTREHGGPARIIVPNAPHCSSLR